MDCYLFLVGVGFDDFVEVGGHIVVGGGDVARVRVEDVGQLAYRELGVAV